MGFFLSPMPLRQTRLSSLQGHLCPNKKCDQRKDSPMQDQCCFSQWNNFKKTCPLCYSLLLFRSFTHGTCNVGLILCYSSLQADAPRHLDWLVFVCLSQAITACRTASVRPTRNAVVRAAGVSARQQYIRTRNTKSCACSEFPWCFCIKAELMHQKQ